MFIMTVPVCSAIAAACLPAIAYIVRTGGRLPYWLVWLIQQWLTKEYTMQSPEVGTIRGII